MQHSRIIVIVSVEEVTVGVDDDHFWRSTDEIDHLRGSFKQILHCYRTVVYLGWHPEDCSVGQSNCLDAGPKAMGKIFQGASFLEKTMKVVEREAQRIEITFGVKEEKGLFIIYIHGNDFEI